MSPESGIFLAVLLNGSVQFRFASLTPYGAGAYCAVRGIDSDLAVLQAEDTRLQAKGAYWSASVDVLRAFSGSIVTPNPIALAPSP